MKKALFLFSALLLLAISSGRVSARLTGTEPGTDVWCAGPSGAEICVDVSGNLIPTTNNDATLGTSALAFSSAYIYDLTISDDLVVAGDVLKTPIASAVLGAGGTIAVAGACGGIVQLTVTANRTTDTTNTFTAPAAANTGCRVDVINGGGGTITLDTNSLFNVASNIVLGTGDSATVFSTGSAWILIGTHDN